MNDTICAIATAPGGALGIVRISGCKAIEAASLLFKAAGGKLLENYASNTAVFGTASAGGRVVDEAIATIYRAPHSYTGENCVELSCHGSQYILGRILEQLVDDGCRLARPGEFTERAFLNGKMDLSQAEAVADIVAARSESSSRIAVNQLRGGLHRELTHLYDAMLKLRSMLELQLDFSDHEDLDFAHNSQLEQMADEILGHINRLASTFVAGNAMRRGIPVVISGCPNVGKSTLLNALINEERALVSDIPGTTRDTIEESLYIDGIEFRIIDTAGLHHTDDTVEKLGIQRTLEKMSEARTLLCVVSALSCRDTVEIPFIDNVNSIDSVIAVINKIDLVPSSAELKDIQKRVEQYLEQSFNCSTAVVCISAKKREGLENLKHTLVEMQGFDIPDMSETIIVSKRHYEALVRAAEYVKKTKEAIQSGISAEIACLELQQADNELSAIGGGTTPQEVLDSIFSHFCIGK
jgi:tRNA modification GTPase